MKTIALLEKNKVLHRMIRDSLSPDIRIKEISDAHDLIRNYDKINPSLIVLDENFAEIHTLDFCIMIREKRSLLTPILLVLNFYSTIDLERLKNLGIHHLVKPVPKEVMLEKIESFFKPLVSLKIKEAEMIEKSQFSSLTESLKPIIRDEVKREILNIFKQFMEVVEKRNG